MTQFIMLLVREIFANIDYLYTVGEAGRNVGAVAVP